MTYVSPDVKPVEDPVTAKSGMLSRMTRQPFQRLAGLRFSYLIKQLQEEDEKKWSIQAIADAIGCDRSLVSKWHPDNVRHRRDPPDRSGLTDLVIQGIRDGLGVNTEYLFMPSRGLPQHVVLPDGSKRPCETDEIDHKLLPVSLDEHRQKVQLKEQGRQLQEQQSELAALRLDVHDLRDMMREFLDAKRNLPGNRK